MLVVSSDCKCSFDLLSQVLLLQGQSYVPTRIHHNNTRFLNKTLSTLQTLIRLLFKDTLIRVYIVCHSPGSVLMVKMKLFKFKDAYSMPIYCEVIALLQKTDEHLMRIMFYKKKTLSL